MTLGTQKTRNSLLIRNLGWKLLLFKWYLEFQILYFFYFFQLYIEVFLMQSSLLCDFFHSSLSTGVIGHACMKTLNLNRS